MASRRYRRAIAFWSFVLVAAYLVYVYPLLRITAWYGRHDAIQWPGALLLWAAVVIGLWLSFSARFTGFKVILVNWLVRRQFRRVKGMHVEGGSRLYISPGTGTWGPVMRLGSRNEITCIDLIADNSGWHE